VQKKPDCQYSGFGNIPVKALNGGKFLSVTLKCFRFYINPHGFTVYRFNPPATPAVAAHSVKRSNRFSGYSRQKAKGQFEKDLSTDKIIFNTSPADRFYDAFCFGVAFICFLLIPGRTAFCFGFRTGSKNGHAG
jgi:hypothetical protein